jgi:leader peptidase (prepilin peptidase)/N-methyltransferase
MGTFVRRPASGYVSAVLAQLEPLAMSSAAYGFVAVLGLLWGSFANVCIYRLPAGRSVVTPASHCTACQTPIRWYDNVPVLAWLWLGGRCRACKAPFSARYLVVELVVAGLFAFSWWAAVVAPSLFEPFDLRLLHFAIYAAFCLLMVVIAVIDLDHQLIFDRVTAPSIALFYAASFAWPERHWYTGLVGAAIGYGVPWAIGEVYFRITKREAMGLGDSMLLAVIGALLGWQGVLTALCGGSIIGVAVAIPALLAARRPPADPEIPVDAPGAGARAGKASSAQAAGAAEIAPGEAPDAAGAPDASGPPDAGDAPPSLLRTELPFGPFLAAAALVYMFAAPWIDIHFHLPGG